MRIFSLTELAAARISSELESEADIKVIIERQLIPSHLKDLILKYIWKSMKCWAWRGNTPWATPIHCCTVTYTVNNISNGI